MSPEAQRIAIAEACGWIKLPDCFSEEVRNAGYLIDPVNYETHVPPDYLNDLNAMHEAEKVLEYVHRNRYWMILNNVCDPNDESEHNSRWTVCHATAAQRAEAFLRTLGLWTE